MYKKIITTGLFNPITNGHLDLFQTGLHAAKKIDIYVERGVKANQIPYHVRTQCIEEVLKNIKLDKKIRIIRTEDNYPLGHNYSQYDALLAGSNQVNEMYGDEYQEQKQAFPIELLKAPNIIILQKFNSELTENVSTKVHNDFSQVSLYRALSSISTSKIRKGLSTNSNVSNLLPKCILNVIKENAHYLKNSENKK